MDPTQWGAPYPVVLAGLFVIVMLRANATYWLGRLGSAGARRTRLAKMMDSPRYQRAVERIDTYGPPVITMSFLTIGFQTLANLAAGAMRMRQRHYLPAMTLGAVLWAFLYATVGTVGFGVINDLFARSPLLGTALLATLAGLLATYIVVRRSRKITPEQSDG